MNLKTFFQLEKYNTTYKKEILAGVTTFFTTSYIIFINPSIVGETGMPYQGLFVSTILAAAICTLFMAFFANTPFAMAPGLGTNTFIAYTVCLGLNYHWKEAMGLTFITGIIHFVLLSTDFRRKIVKAIPRSLKYATSAGIGFFVIYIGLKNAGLISFTLNPGQYVRGEGGVIIGNSQTYQGLIDAFTLEHILVIFGLFVIIGLLSLEKRTGDSFGAFLLGILSVTFVGIPLGVTNIASWNVIDTFPLESLKEVACSFFGTPGLMSAFETPSKILTSVMVIIVLLMTSLVDSVSTISGIGQLDDSPIFDEEDLEKFNQIKGISSKLDRALMADSTGNIVAGLMGTTGATTYIESVTGIAAGGRTGLTSLVVAVLFLLCLPFSSILSIVPSSATAAALIVSGMYLVSLLKHIEWNNFDEVAPVVLILVFIPFTSSILNGVGIGFTTYILVSIVMGRRKQVHPILYMIAIVFTLILILKTIFIA